MTDIVFKRTAEVVRNKKTKSIFDAEPIKTATLSGLLNQLDGCLQQSWQNFDHDIQPCR